MEQTVDFSTRAAYTRGWQPETRNRSIDSIEYDIELEEWVATAMTGAEVYGATEAECEARLREANRVWIEHCRKTAAIYIDINRVQDIRISDARITGGTG